MAEQLVTLVMVVFGAALMPLAARRLSVPSAALEIVYGMLLFNTVLAHHPAWFELLKELGLIYLMFIAGTELSLRELRSSGRILRYVLIPLPAFIIMPFLLHFLGLPWYIGIVLAMISAGIVIPVLKEADLLKLPLGRDILGVALAGELISILALTFLNIFHQYGFTPMALLDLLKLVALLGLAGLGLKLLYLLAWWHPGHVDRVMRSEDPTEEGIRLVISVAFVGGLAAFAAGVEPILGSFMGGVIFSHVFKSKGRFEDKINAVGFGFLTPFFFIGVGAAFDPVLLRSPKTVLLAVGLTLLLLASKLLPLLPARIIGLRGIEAFGMALLLAAPLSLLVVAGTLGQKMGLLSPSLNGMLILTAVLASIVYPMVFRLLAPRLKQDKSK
jgi:Kef-type K+ transport system membrane component KefB